MASESFFSFEPNIVRASLGSHVGQQIAAMTLECDTLPSSPTSLYSPLNLERGKRGKVADTSKACREDVLTRALAEVRVSGSENTTDTGSETLTENTTDTSSEALPEIQAQANTPDIDPSLLFGMERTLYSAVNVGALVIMFGFGLMMVSPARFQQYYIQGCIIAVAGLTFIGCSWLNHFMRMRILSQGGEVTICNSAAWTGCLMFLMCVCVCLELYYGYTHPYMERSMPVDVNNPNSGLPAMTTSAP